MLKKQIKNIGVFGLFLMVFLYSYNSSYINGDDVEHLRRNIFGTQYLPYQFPGWIPNRLFDQYGRAIASLIIDQLYYFLINFRIDAFVVSYKIFSAILYTIIIFFAYRLVRTVACLDGLKPAFDFILIKILVLVSLLCILPYVNQVHMICYQLPTLLAYFLIINLACVSNMQKLVGASRYILIYICAFTLESISLIILLFSIHKLALSYFEKEKLDNYLEHIFSVIVNLSSLAIVVLFSKRIEVVQGYTGVYKFDFLSGFKELFPFFKSTSGLFLLIGLIIAISMALYQMRKVCLVDFKLVKSLATPIFLCYLAVYVISVRSGHDYFNVTEYPWGDLYLISKIGMLTLAIYVISRIVIAGGWASNVVVLFLFILTSALVVQFHLNFDSKSKMAYSVTKIWREISTSEGGRSLLPSLIRMRFRCSFAHCLRPALRNGLITVISIYFINI